MWRLNQVLPARVDRLRVKLFLAIAGANALLALLAFLIFSRSFDQGFVEYLNRADEARLIPLMEQLAEGYQQHRDWDWLVQDRRHWQQLVREALGGRGMGPDGPGALHEPEPGERRRDGPGPKPVLTIDPRLLLLDTDRQLLLGRHEMLPEAILRPIQVANRPVGYLGYVPRLSMVASLEKVFSAQQNRKFAAIAVGLLVSGLLIGGILAYWLARRIRSIAQATSSLIQGDYQSRIQWQGQDELAQLAQDINRLAETLAAAQKARQQWIADIAHELRTPLTSLKAEIEALEDGVRQFGSETLSSLGQEVQQLARLVEDLHVLSLSDLGALSYSKQPLELAELIDDCLRGRRLQLQDSRLDLQLDLAEGLYLLADAARLTQVFANLLQNTLNYTDSPGQLRVTAQRAGAWLDVHWQDSAPGVSERDLPRLTDRLFRVEASRSRAQGGSGLGLAIAKAIIEAHGGSMQASHSCYGGLAWHLRLPATDKGGRHG